ncbi:MAG: glycosyltransferase family 2 protein [Verrucomicrobiota bacterium]
MSHSYSPEAYSHRTAPDADGTEYEYDVCIGLLCYRDKQRIDDLLASLEASPQRYKYEVLLSDNGSVDGTREMVREKYPYVKILENGANLGVAGGRNRLFWNTRSKYTMILDSDTLLHANTVDTLVDVAESNPKVGIVHPKLVYRDQRLQLSIRPFPSIFHIAIEGTKLRGLFEWTGLPARIQMRNCGHDHLMEFDCCYGAGLIIRNSVLKQIGGFDEGYFYQYEDYDLCYRVKAAGYENWYQPAATMTHFYEREDTVFHPGLKKHLKSILRFQMRNIWKISKTPPVHTRKFDGDLVPPIGIEPAVAQ